MNDHGILLLDKPGGMSSARAVAKAKRQLQIKKAGHGGTLDPLAQGLLVLLFGEATRYAGHLLGGDKAYTATVRFGIASDSDDADGTLTETAPPPPNLGARLSDLLPAFSGDIEQTAPAYSALKHNGKPLYAYARSGKPAPAKTRRVRINTLTLENATDTSATLHIACGAGTYIRALARDLGAALGCGAHLTALTRTRSGRFSLDDAVTLDALEKAATAEKCRELLLPIENAVCDLPAITLPDDDVRKLGGGIVVPQHHAAAVTATPTAADNNSDTVRVFAPCGKFAGLATQQNGDYRPLRLLHWTRATQ